MTTVMLGMVFHETEPGSMHKSVEEMVNVDKACKWKAYNAEKLAVLGLRPGYKHLFELSYPLVSERWVSCFLACLGWTDSLAHRYTTFCIHQRRMGPLAVYHPSRCPL